MLKNNNGFTLVEIIVVLTLIAIVGTVAVMSYPKIVLRSKLKSDLQSVRVIQSSLDLYIMEGNTVPLAVTDISKELYDAGYLKTNTKPQIDENAKWYFSNSTKKVKLDASKITNTETDVWQVINDAPEEDRELIHGFTFATKD